MKGGERRIEKRSEAEKEAKANAEEDRKGETKVKTDSTRAGARGTERKREEGEGGRKREKEKEKERKNTILAVLSISPLSICLSRSVCLSLSHLSQFLSASLSSPSRSLFLSSLCVCIYKHKQHTDTFPRQQMTSFALLLVSHTRIRNARVRKHDRTETHNYSVHANQQKHSQYGPLWQSCGQ